MVLSVFKEKIRLRFLNNLEIYLVCCPTYVNLAHLFFV